MVLQYDAGSGVTTALMDVGGDSVADFMLRINGHLTTTDGFVL